MMMFSFLRFPPSSQKWRGTEEKGSVTKLLLTSLSAHDTRNTMHHILLLLCLLLGTLCLWDTEGFQNQPRRRNVSRCAAPSRTDPPSAHRTPPLRTQLPALLDPHAASTLLSQENIVNAFSVATFLPQPFWVLLTIIPNSGATKKIMGGMEIVTLCALVHFFIVVASIAQQGGSAPIAEFAGVFDPAGAPQKAFIGMMQYPNFITEEWSHVLTWDLFVGRWIWLDGLKRGVFTSHSVLLCNLIGPPGLLLHWATCLVTSKGIIPNEVPTED